MHQTTTRRAPPMANATASASTPATARPGRAGSLPGAGHAPTGHRVPLRQAVRDERRRSDPRAPLEDRRRYSLETLRRSVVAPRRTSARRREDRRYPMLDRFDGGMLALAVALVGLSVLDSTFTLMLLAAGGREVNPFMAWLLEYGVAPFAAVKMLLTGVPAVLLVATGNFRVFGRIRARSLLAALVGLYGGLIVYEIGLLSLV